MKRGYLAAVDYRLFVDNIDWDAVRDASKHSYSLKDLNSNGVVVFEDTGDLLPDGQIIAPHRAAA